MGIFVIILVCIVMCFYVFLFLFARKISVLEETILHHFKEKNNLMPGIYEITKPYFQKHEEVFYKILELRQVDFAESLKHDDFYEIINHQQKFHKEINFIFRISVKHDKLIRDGKFLYLRDLLVDKSEIIGEYVQVYRQVTSTFNRLVHIKNYTVIGLLFPISYRIEI